MPIVIANPATPPSSGWDLTSALFEKSFDVSLKAPSPSGFAFSPDGTRMYVTGFTSDAVHQYALSVAWDIGSGTTTFVQSKGVTATAPKEVLFSPDGLKMYISDTDLDDLHQWTLGTAWDISTATDDGVPFSFNSQDSNPNGVTFKSDGTKAYMVGLDNDTVYQYSLGTAWDINTMSVDVGVTKLISGEEINPTSVTFKSDGTVMYITGFTNNVYQYPLSVAWDLSTAGASSANVSVSTPPETQTRGVLFKSDGTKMYTVGTSADSIHQFGSL